MPPPASSPPPRNGVLAVLPPEDEAALRSWLEPVDLRPDEALSPAGEPMAHVYFPTSGAAALMVVRDGTRTVAIDLIGRDGVVGIEALLGTADPLLQPVVAFRGRALRVEAALLAGLAEERPALRHLLLRHAQARLLQAAQAAACHARHSLVRRLAHWLIFASEQTGGAGLSLTHDLLAQMLAVRRPGITTALHELEGAGMIRATYGRIQILDRDGLRHASCGCRTGFAPSPPAAD